jgi:hypothetical protein
MTAILGPLGALPPGEWAIGCRAAVVAYWHAITIDRAADDGVIVFRIGGGVSTWDANDLCIDLTRGCLSHATRALLHLVAPAEVQPDCAPGWERFGRQWTMTLHHGNGWDTKWRFTEGGVYSGYARLMDTPIGMLTEERPRAALRLALFAAAGVTP